MKNISLILERNFVNKKYKYNKIKVRGGMLYYNLSSKEISGNELKDIIDIINYTNEKYPANTPLVLDLSNTSIRDKLVYIMLECIIYSEYTIKKRKIYVAYSNRKTSIWTEGINYSCLQYLTQRNYQKFIDRFNFDIYMGHYRKIIRYDSDKDALSKTAQDIRNFLINNGVLLNDVNTLTEVITEVAGNAIEHSATDCLIDIDVTDTAYTKPDATDDSLFYGMNVAIVSFSSVLFYETLKDKMDSISSFIDENRNLPERYLSVYKAKENHKKAFNNDNYSENDFYMISSYQNKISGKKKKGYTGGTGLTYLIDSLAESSEADYCYMMTGNRVLFFVKEFLKYDDDGWIGFNEDCDYLSQIPNLKCFGSGRTYVPGTSYNLCFVIRKDNKGSLNDK